MILYSEVRNQDKNPYGISGGNDTKERVFLLSYEEAKNGKYFNNSSERKTTLYDGGWCWWWLRSPGFNSGCAARVGDDGYVYDTGREVRDGSVAVRPALWINLKS